MSGLEREGALLDEYNKLLAEKGTLNSGYQHEKNKVQRCFEILCSIVTMYVGG
jgi:hypothetical protein